MMELRASQDMDREAMQEIHEAMVKEIEVILTEDQRVVFTGLRGLLPRRGPRHP